ncbi:nucleolar protein 58-like isoform X2 [Elysia marginata]|uniref:Nucleolar protein 58-like isoform X2 n=1 Tax=Elysia marginata TaxID=1093978 RepID=A0AAV4J627_9GAST|nr:nucleolar protein 58-like isoform X2 [Elysia marginata]
MLLVGGNSFHCQRRKLVNRPCKEAGPTQAPDTDTSGAPYCEYVRGNWTACDSDTQRSTRMDQLVKGDPANCQRFKQFNKRCKKACKYTLDDWSDCDPVTDKRSRVKRLTGGDPTACGQEMTISRPCRDKHGVERCFYGNWGEFGPCTNGVSTKVRPMLQGGVECERKAVITKACEK